MDLTNYQATLARLVRETTDLDLLQYVKRRLIEHKQSPTQTTIYPEVHVEGTIAREEIEYGVQSPINEARSRKVGQARDKIMQLIGEVNDDSIFDELSFFLEQRNASLDFVVPAHHLASLERADRELKEGQFFPHREVMEEIRKGK